MLPQHEKKGADSDCGGADLGGFSALNLRGRSISNMPLITPGPENMPPGKHQDSPNVRLSELPMKIREMGLSQKQFRREGSPGNKATPHRPDQTRERERDRDFFFLHRSARRAEHSTNRLRGLRQTLSSPGATIGSLERGTPPQRREKWEVFDEVRLASQQGSGQGRRPLTSPRTAGINLTRSGDHSDGTVAGNISQARMNHPMHDQENRPLARRSLAQNFETFDQDDDDEEDHDAMSAPRAANRSSQPLEAICQGNLGEEVWVDADLNFSSEALYFWHRDRVEQNVGGWYDFKIFEDPVLS
mmetsp:Transcript_49419/g.105206  ORF Transcript_49419/g.105206 Transcript_49419/m.105206 type:complete len:302 (-) Transcript_49419:43-948(-)|eukprot:CAMPEP_0206566680 /NCGR_PEP_ID=MMETSP0325_2-20121206/24804_1 /ASSEMBLY_ACC=CAM_ASM_000347 /TAXON_ID=2866 /ORGANISM="Crypthecodinium cohnii, Strain Seligo" /LENGTH=301 /DNA_ID=CAMNT_0054069759 /DNA_START=446 /DNA_END=1351 /DNA_ORIENTATION=+